MFIFWAVSYHAVDKVDQTSRLRAEVSAFFLSEPLEDRLESSSIIAYSKLKIHILELSVRRY